MRRLHACFLLLVAGSSAATQLPERPTDVEPGADAVKCERGVSHVAYIPRLLQVEVNGTPTRRELVFLQRPCGAVLASSADLRLLRVRVEDKPSIDINGQAYLNLNDYEGLRYVLDEARQRMVIEGEPHVFYPTIIDAGPPRLPPSPSPPYGAFLNYGMLGTGAAEGGEPNLNANAGLGIFGPPGVLTSDWLWSRYAGTESTRRIATTFTHDFEELISTLRVGDVFARGAAFGGGAPLGGVQYARNFAVSPRIVISPVQMMEAATRRTALMDLSSSELADPSRASQAAFMSGARPVPYGPVELVNVPTYGNGQYQMTLRDMFGNEVQVQQPYFFNQGLLRSGLHDFSYEAGVLRSAFPDDDYSGGFGAGTHRYGFNNWFTGEAHGEAGADGQALGVTGLLAVPWVGVVSGTVAGSRADPVDGIGAFGALGLENQYADYSYALRTECADESFRMPAAVDEVNNVSCRSYALGTSRLPWGHSLGLSVSTANQRQAPDTTAALLTYSMSAWRASLLQVSVGWIESTTRTVFAGLNFFLPFAPARLSLPGSLFESSRTSFNLTANGSSDADSTAFGLLTTGAGPPDNAIGLQAGSALDGRDERTVSAGWTGASVLAHGGYRTADGIGTYSAGASSALVLMDGSLFTSLPLTGSFAAVRLGEDYPNVRVNGVRTDSDGDVLITRLQPYYENLVDINPSDLPGNVRIDEFQYVVRPRFRSGVVVKPAVTIARDAILTVEMVAADGRRVPVPPGAYATVAGSDEAFPFGEDGLLYVAGLGEDTEVTVHHGEGQCRLRLSLPERLEPNATPELGTYLCNGLHP